MGKGPARDQIIAIKKTDSTDFLLRCETAGAKAPAVLLYHKIYASSEFIDTMRLKTTEKCDIKAM